MRLSDDRFPFAMTFRQLAVFVETIEAGSFRASADRLDISQASVSTHIAALEEHLGKELFVRQRGNVAGPTLSGMEAYRHAKALLSRADRFVRAFDFGKSQGRRKLRLAAHPLLAGAMSPALAKFASDHPDVDIVLQAAPYEHIADLMHRNDLDIGYFYSYGGRPLEPNTTILTREPLAIYVHREHDLAALGEVLPSDVNGYPIVSFPLRSHMQQVIERALMSIGIDDCAVALEADSMVLTRQAVIMGIGFGCLFQRLVEGDSVSAGMVELPIQIPPLDGIQWISPRMARDPLSQAWVDCLIGALGQDNAPDRSAEVGGKDDRIQ